MSYAFSARAATKGEVMKKVAAELDKVVASQPVHSADRAQAQEAAKAFLGVIPEPSSVQDVNVSVSGSVSWNGTDTKVVTAAGVNVSASLVAKE